jgi:hypothetical protein
VAPTSWTRCSAGGNMMGCRPKAFHDLRRPWAVGRLPRAQATADGSRRHVATLTLVTARFVLRCIPCPREKEAKRRLAEQADLCTN